MLALLRALRTLAGWIDFVVLTLVVYGLTFLPWQGRHPVARLFHTWCRAFVRAIDIDLRLHQHNRRRLPEHFILIANHPSAFEDIGIPALFDVVSLAKVQVKDWFVVGRISQAAGTLYVDRDDADSRQQAIETMVRAVEGGTNLALYPEGGCKGRRLFTEFKSGAFEVSMRTGVPIVPVFLHYEAQDDFEWQDPYTLPDKIRHMMSTVNNRANYHVFDPLDPKDFADKYAMKAEAYRRFSAWNDRFLE
ncbi:MAG: 1-acyl-sn-glycerol-3-phosphate acyltransferase [Rhodocyclaceae bacterium]|nr:1-acyl-sn-glycerol-3-phosphate acyltransferase [Rhodocyclaceae bacterium]